MAERVVLCMRWGSFDPVYVNILYRAVSDHIEGNFTFACITDDPVGLAPGIEALPLGELETGGDTGFPGVWPKVGVYRKDLFGIEGRILYLDLDIVVTGSLDEMFTLPGEYFGMTDEKRAEASNGATQLNTSVFSFDAGEQSQILDRYLKDREVARETYGNDQNFAEAHARGLHFWPKGWVISFKRHLRRRIGADLIFPVLEPPVGTKIVAFHGRPRPVDLIGRKFLWSQPPHSVRLPVRWLNEYWERYGD